jgi:hypothetical protein
LDFGLHRPISILPTFFISLYLPLSPSLPMTPDTAAPRLTAATPLMPLGPGPLGRHGPEPKKHDLGSMRHVLSRARAWPDLPHRAWACISASSVGTDMTCSNRSHGSQSLIPFPHAPRPLDLPVLGEAYIRPPHRGCSPDTRNPSSFVCSFSFSSLSSSPSSLSRCGNPSLSPLFFSPSGGWLSHY